MDIAIEDQARKSEIHEILDELEVLAPVTAKAYIDLVKSFSREIKPGSGLSKRIDQKCLELLRPLLEGAKNI